MIWPTTDERGRVLQFKIVTFAKIIIIGAKK